MGTRCCGCGAAAAASAAAGAVPASCRHPTVAARDSPASRPAPGLGARQRAPSRTRRTSRGAGRRRRAASSCAPTASPGSRRAIGRATAARLGAVGRAARRRAAAAATGAPSVHLQHETFLYGGAGAGAGRLRRSPRCARRPAAVVTMHHVVDPGAVDADFVARTASSTGRSRAPGWPRCARRSRAWPTRSSCTSPRSRRSCPARPCCRTASRHRRRGTMPGTRAGSTATGCRAVLRLHLAVQGARAGARGRRLAGRRVSSSSPAAATRAPATPTRRACARRAAPNARFTGHVPDGDVARWFAAADVLLLPYPRPFATSGPLALALAHGTPVLLSPALRTRRRAAGAGRRARPPGARRPAARLRDDAAEGRAALRERTRDLAAGRAWPPVAARHLEL